MKKKLTRRQKILKRNIFLSLCAICLVAVISLTANTAKNSYNRTKNIIASGLTEIQQYLGCEVRFEH